jgi:hypothetical protein
VRSLAPPPIIADDYDNRIELSEEMEEETDAKTASQGETDDVSQPYVIMLLSLKRLSYDSLANLNLNQKRKNLRFNSGLFSFQSKFSAHADPTAPPIYHICSIKIYSTDEAALQ